MHNNAKVTEYYGLAPSDRVGADVVRTYPVGPIAAEGYVNLDGGEIGDRVWLDLDGDGGPGHWDADEPGIPGVGVTITGPSGSLTRAPTPTGSD